MRKQQTYLNPINEDTATTIVVRKVGSDGSVVEPTTLKYKVDCRTTRTALVAWTDVTTPMAENRIDLAATVNAIQNDRNESEVKVLTAMADEGLATQSVEEYAWEVVNLYGTGA